MELQEIFENFMSAKRLAGLADKSLYNYDLFIHSFVNFIGSQTSLSDLTQERVSRTGKELTCNAVKHMMFSIQRKLPFEFSSHKLRHNFATNYCIDQYEKTGQIDIYKLMLLMGHEDIETTRVYLHHANQIIASKMNISHLDKVFFGEN